MPDMPNSDKVIHFSAFAGLAFLMAWAIPTFPNKLWMSVSLALILTITYGAIDEISQTPVGRTADVMDWVADSIGAVFGILCYVVLRQIIVMLGKSQPESQPMTLEVPLG